MTGPPLPRPAELDPLAGEGARSFVRRFARLTGLRCRVVVRTDDGGERVLHDSLSSAAAEGAPVRAPVAALRGRLEVAWAGPGGGARRAEAAARLLCAWTARLLEYEAELRLFSRGMLECYDQITLLTSIGDLLGSGFQVERAVEKLLDEVLEVVGAERATLWIREDPEAELRPVLDRARGRRGAAASLADTPPSEQERLAHHAFREQKSALLPAGERAGGPAEAALVVPVTYAPGGGDGRRLGALHLTGRPGGGFTAGDLRLLEAVGTQVGAAIQHGRLLHERLRRERLAAELEIAHDLQLRLLPRPEEFADLADVAARCEPAHGVGGDFYLLVRLGPGRVGVMLGDVSSHGVSAALVMALSMSAASIHARAADSPAEVLRLLQRQIQRELESTEMYLTLFYGVLDRDADRLLYANAGHAFAWQLTGSEAVRLPALDPPVGLTSPGDYRQGAVPWRPADLLLLCTDGLVGTLADDPRRADEILTERALEASPRGPAAVVESLFESLGRAGRADDRSALALRL